MVERDVMDLHTDSEQFRYRRHDHIWLTDPTISGCYISTEHPVACDYRFKQLPISQSHHTGTKKIQYSGVINQTRLMRVT